MLGDPTTITVYPKVRSFAEAEKLLDMGVTTLILHHFSVPITKAEIDEIHATSENIGQFTDKMYKKAFGSKKIHKKIVESGKTHQFPFVTKNTIDYIDEKAMNISRRHGKIGFFWGVQYAFATIWERNMCSNCIFEDWRIYFFDLKIDFEERLGKKGD